MFGKGFLATAFIITFVTFISKLIGFFREVCIGYFYGPSDIIDVYLVVTSIPDIIAGVIACIGSAYIPVYIDIRWKEGHQKANGFTNWILLVLGGLCLALIVVCIFDADYIIKGFSPGFSEKMSAVAIRYFQITIVNVFFLVFANLFSCYLRCNENFIVSPVSMVAHGIVQIVFVVISSRYGEDYLVYGAIVSNIVYLLILLFSSFISGYKFMELYINQEYLKTFGMLSVPIIAGTFLVQAGSYVDKYFASFLTSGSVSEIYYARLITTFAVTMLTTGIMSMFAPLISNMASQGELEETQKMFRLCLTYMLCGLIPVACVFMVLSYDIMNLLFGRGKFNNDAIQMTSMAMKMFAVGITATGICDLFYNFFYSLKNSQKPLGMNFFLLLLNIGFDYVFVRWMGLQGLALGASISSILTVLLGFVFIQDYMEAKGLLFHMVSILLKSGCISMVALFPILCCKTVWAVHGLGLLILDSVIFSSLYCLLLWRMHIPEIDILIQRLQSKRKGVMV